MSIRKVASLLALAAFFVYWVTSPGETPYNYFSRLAVAFTDSKLYLTEGPAHLNELIPISDGRFFVPYAPMPALLLAVPTLLFGGIVSQTLFANIVGAVIVFFSTLIAFEISKKSKVAVAIGITAAFGTGYWYLASVGSSWYFGQLVGILFLTIAIYFKLKNYSALFYGLMLGFAYLARPHMILAFPFFLLSKKDDLLKTIIFFSVGVLPSLLFNFWYNFERFGVFYDKGYELIPGVLDEIWYTNGIFHYSYIPRQLKASILELPRFQNEFPYVVPSLIGMAYWIANPIVLIIFFFKKGAKNYFAFLAAILILIPILMHGSQGFTQFGYRFGLDIMPFILLLAASSLNKFSENKLILVLLAISIIINAWGVLMINIFDIYVI